MQCVYMFQIHGGSRNKMNGLACYGKYFKENFELQFPGLTWAHFDTVNNAIGSVSTDDLSDARKLLIKQLIRKKVCRAKDGYHHIIFDGTGVCSYKNAPVDNAYYRTKNGTTTYYAYVLEAKLLTNDNMVLSVASEMLNNDNNEEFDKQDCEAKAFKRLAARIHEDFPRLPICIHLDGLYANGPVMDICEQYGWKYIITRKDGNLKKLDEQIIDKSSKEKKVFSYPVVVNPKGKNVIYGDASFCWVDELTHQDHQFNYMEGLIPVYDPKQEAAEFTKFAYITNLEIKGSAVDNDKLQKAVIARLESGRVRWKIENEGFNIQKNNGFNMEHKFVRNSIINLHKYYILLQIAHIITQLAIKSKVVSAFLAKDGRATVQLLWTMLMSVITVTLLDAEKLCAGRAKCQIRLE